MRRKIKIGVFVLFGLTSCQQKNDKPSQKDQMLDIPLSVFKDTLPRAAEKSETGKIEKSLLAAGLVNISDVDSTIVVNLKYSTRDNFLNADVYEDLEHCYLQKDVAQKLAIAQLLLKSKYPYYSLFVYDGARPRNVQQIMWDMLKVPASEKTKYLSNPNSGSLHNFGAAVDISIIDESGKELDMGTRFDYFGELAYPEKEEQLNIQGKLSFQQISNRKLLRSVMNQAGFFNIETEWWHFNSCKLTAAVEKYQIIP